MGFFSPAPYHILSYGTLLGTTFFHTFVGSIAAFKVLPRSQFSALMATIFPVYFAMQALLALVLAATYPTSKSPLGATGGMTGVLDPVNRWSVLAPLAGAFLSGLANLAVIGPATTRVMGERKRQEKKDGKKAYDPPPHSEQMKALNSRFSMLHGVSSLLNLVTLIGVVGYGITLSARLA